MSTSQVLVCCMTNISNVSFAQCWRLETSSRPFNGFIKTTIKQDLVIFNSWHIPFSVVPYSPFQGNETLESWLNWLLSNWRRLLNWKGLELSPSPPNCSEDFSKLLPLLMCIDWPSLVTYWVVAQKIYSKMYPVTCTNTHHDVIDLLNHEMVKNSKT